MREIDAGVVDYRTWAGDEAHAYFANVGSAGISGAIAQRANESSKALGGKVSYYWATLAVFVGWQAGEMRVTVGDETRSGRMIDAMVCNGRFLGGGMMMCPDAEPDDGLFDVLLIGDVTKRDLAFVLPKTYKGKHLPHPRLELLRGTVVTVDADEPLPIELDGEQPGTTPARFEVLPRVLRLRVPAPPRRPAWRGAVPRSSAWPAPSRASRHAPRARRSRTFFARSSTRVRRSFTAVSAFCPPGSSAMRWSASSPASASRVTKSCRTWASPS